MKTVFSRVHFCEDCYKANRPIDEGFFFVFAGTRQKTQLRRYHASKTYNERAFAGYMPHMFFLEKVREDGNYDVLYCCAWVGCGMTLVKEEDTPSADVLVAKRKVMTPREWEALGDFTDTGYEL